MAVSSICNFRLWINASRLFCRLFHSRRLRFCLVSPPFLPPRRQTPLQSHPLLLVKSSVVLMSTPPRESESPSRTVPSCTPPPGYAEVFSAPENNYVPVQFTFYSIGRFFLAFLRICVTCFLSHFDFFVVPLFSIVTSLMVDTIVIPVNLRWLLPHL